MVAFANVISLGRAPSVRGAGSEWRAGAIGPDAAIGEEATDVGDAAFARPEPAEASDALVVSSLRGATDRGAPASIETAAGRAPSLDRARCVGAPAGSGRASAGADGPEDSGEAAAGLRVEIDARADCSRPSSVRGGGAAARRSGSAPLFGALGGCDAGREGPGAGADSRCDADAGLVTAGAFADSDRSGASPSSGAESLAKGFAADGRASAGTGAVDATNCAAQLGSRKGVARLAAAGAGSAAGSPALSSPSPRPLADSADAAAPCPSAPRTAAASNCDIMDPNSCPLAPPSSTAPRDG
jgi:hypothetical protein